MGAVDEGTEEPAAAVGEADLILLAAPVGAILDLLPRLKEVIRPGSLITDVGSTKRLICQRAGEIFGDDPLFLGGHPLTGKEHSGLENAEATLYEGTRYVLTPLRPEHANDPRARAFSSLLQTIGARPYWSDASDHDRAVAFLSHLPQLLSSSLASLVSEENLEQKLPLELAASGFRDMTRLAESPYSVWRDICLTNIENIHRALEAMIDKLDSMKMHLSDRGLEREFGRAAQLRDKLHRTD